MKKIVIPLACLASLLVFIGGASAVGKTIVVHKPSKPACTSGDDYINKEEYCVHNGDDINEACKAGTYPNPNDEVDLTIGVDCRGAIQEAYYRTCQSPDDAIIICPGDYNENVRMVRKVNNRLTVKSYTHDPQDPMNPEKNAIVHAKIPDNDVFYVTGLLGVTISGLTITGATRDAPCLSSVTDDPLQPCAGIRFFCMINGVVKDNHITGNNNGVIVKDTYPGWSFFNFIEDNVIYGNSVGVHFRYGSNSYITNNLIYDNPVGISVIDTWQNKIVGNTVEDNNLGVEIKASGLQQKHCSITTTKGCEFDAGCPQGETCMRDGHCNETQTMPCIIDADCPVGETCTGYCSETVTTRCLTNDDCQIGETCIGGIKYPRGEATSDNVFYSNTFINSPIYDDAPYPVPLSPGSDLNFACPYDCFCPWDPVAQDYICRHFWESVPACGIRDVVRNMDQYLDTLEYFSSLQDALNSNYRRYQIQAATFNENLTIDSTAKPVITFFSGYDCNYITNNGLTKLKGQLRIASGTLRIMGGTFKVTDSN